METPKDLFALICEDGRLYPDDVNGSHSRSDADELQEQIAHAGAECVHDCDKHRIVKYVAATAPVEFQRKGIHQLSALLEVFKGLNLSVKSCEHTLEHLESCRECQAHLFTHLFDVKTVVAPAVIKEGTEIAPGVVVTGIDIKPDPADPEFQDPQGPKLDP